MIFILLNQRQECDAQMGEGTIESNYIQIVPNLQVFDLCFFCFFFNFLVMQKPYAFSTNLISNFEFWSFLGFTMCGRILSHDTRQQPWAQAPIQPYDHEDKQLIYLRPFCTQTTILFLTFSTVFCKLHDLFNTIKK